MFVSQILFVCFVACVFAADEEDSDKLKPFKLVVNSLTCKYDRTLNIDVSGIKVYFYDYANNFNTTFMMIDAAEGILNVARDKSRPFTMSVGGYTSHVYDGTQTQMRDAYKTKPETYLIIPDHYEYTHGFGMGGYEQAVMHVYYIGKALGEMWAKINLGGVSASNIHCVGFSLGGQILGHVGTTFTEMTGEKISRVTALDPAGPCFAKSSKEDQVRSGVAQYVEVYHCNAGGLGSLNILGDIDFFVNERGVSQPNCKYPWLPTVISDGFASVCAHKTCVDLWTASVKHPLMFTAYICESYEEFKNNNCNEDTAIAAGDANPGVAKGLYYVSTAMYDLKNFVK